MQREGGPSRQHHGKRPGGRPLPGRRLMLSALVLVTLLGWLQLLALITL